MHLLLLVLSLARSITAFTAVSFPRRVVADQDTSMILLADYEEGDSGEGSVDARFSHYDVFLSGTLPQHTDEEEGDVRREMMPLCMLLNRTEVRGGVSEQMLRVPASAVPASAHYELAVQQYRIRDGDYVDVMPDFSTTPPSPFKLVMPSVSGDDDDDDDGNGNEDGGSSEGGGHWAEFESDPRIPYGIGDPLGVPCHAYDCVRRCFQSHYPDFVERPSDMSVIRPMIRCKADCPGVYIPDEMRDFFDGTSSHVDGEAKSGGNGQEL